MTTQERIDLEKFMLKVGSHKSIDEGACVMELVSYMANEPWSDHPKCACPILTEYAIRINDKFNDENRQKLKPLITKLIGTRSTDAVQIKRKQLLMWRNVTATYPLILELIKYPDLPKKLRDFGNNVEDMAAAAKLLNENSAAIKKYANAYAYAYANANANANAYAYAYAYANAYAYAYAYANAYANANANANAYAYANADAYAKKFRDELADICVETLNMACEITE